MKDKVEELVNLIIDTDNIGTWNLDRREIVAKAKELKEKING